MRILASILIIFFSSPSFAKMIRIAVIDTGILPQVKVPLCPTGHKDFTGEGLVDTNGHGTNISGLIDQYARPVEYCQIIIKYYTESLKGMKKTGKYPNLQNTILAFDYATQLGVDYINYSSSGIGFDEEESIAIKRALDKGIKVVVPSGNARENLDEKCNTYPACYDKRLIVVGRNDPEVLDTKQVGVGRIVDVLENGYKKSAFGIELSGTSQATAITTGKLVLKELLYGSLKKCRDSNKTR